MRKPRLTRDQLYWLGKLCGWSRHADGKVFQGFAPRTVNPGRRDGAEWTLETLHRRGMVVWSSSAMPYGFAITEAGAAAWLAHNPDCPPLPYVELLPTPVDPDHGPTYVPPRPKPKREAVVIFSAEELEMIAERFAGANDPVGQRIHEKASR